MALWRVNNPWGNVMEVEEGISGLLGGEKKGILFPLGGNHDNRPRSYVCMCVPCVECVVFDTEKAPTFSQSVRVILVFSQAKIIT